MTETCRHCGGEIVPCKIPNLVCKGWKHTEFIDSMPVGAHYCEGRSIRPSAEPEATSGPNGHQPPSPPLPVPHSRPRPRRIKTMTETGDDFLADRHADLDAGENGGAMSDADYYDRIATATVETPRCRTCNNTGQVWTTELDGEGEYDSACPDCDTPYPDSAAGLHHGEAPF